MQKLTGSISEDEYQRKFNEIWDLELSDHTAFRDSFVQRLIRLDSPKEMKVPKYLSKEVTLYQGIDIFFSFIKWLILIMAIIFFIIEYFKNAKMKPLMPISPDTNPRSTVDPRRKKESKLRQLAAILKHQGTGMLTIVNVITPDTEKYQTMVIAQSDPTGKSLIVDENGIIAKNEDGSPMFYKPFGHEFEAQEITIEDWVAGKMEEYDLNLEAKDLLSKNQVQVDGKQCILTGDQNEEGYIAVSEDGSDTVIPTRTIDNIRNSGQQNIDLMTTN